MNEGALEYLTRWLVLPVAGMVLLAVLVAAGIKELDDAVSPVEQRAPVYCAALQPGGYYTDGVCLPVAWWTEQGR